jgi:hypothetical protein
MTSYCQVASLLYALMERGLQSKCVDGNYIVAAAFLANRTTTSMAGPSAVFADLETHLQVSVSSNEVVLH